MKKEHLENFELSLNQKRSWFLDNDNLHGLYNVVALTFLVQPKVNALTEILREIVRTHEALSSAIYLDENTNVPLQVPNYFEELSVTIHPVSRFDQWMESSTDTCEPNSATSQPISFYLFEDEENNIAKLVLKAQSFWTDLFGCFKLIENIETRLNGKTIMNEDDEDFVIHRNFAAWQNELIQEEDNEGLLFWSNYEYDLIPNNIPFGNKSPEAFNPKKVRIGKIKSNAMVSSDSEELELDFLSCFIDFLRVYQTEGFTLGYTLFSRIYEELNETVGLITKTVPLTVTNDLLNNGRGTLADQLEEIRDWSDYYGADYREKNVSQQKFQTNFQFINLNEVVGKYTNLAIDSVFSAMDSFVFKLEVTLLEKYVEVNLYYDQSCFSDREIDVIKSQMARLLGDKFDLTTDQKFLTDEILNSLQGEIRPVEPVPNVFQLIEEHIKQSPARSALIKKGQELTYEQLGKRVDTLAKHFVKTIDHLSDRPIAILLEDPIAYVLSMLGVMKAGGHFLPLEPKTPRKRLEFILEDSGSAALISEESLIGELNFSEKTIEYSSIPESDSSQNIETIAAEVAYVIYTSGSTGNPKGVKVGHHSLTNYLNWAKSYYPLGNSALFTSFSFDLTLTSILLPLVSGKSVIATQENTAIDDVLTEILANPSVELIKLTPSHINLINILSAKANGAKTFICGGEALSMEQVGYLFDLGDHIEVFNEYGPTEATIGCVVKKVLKSDDKVLIGRPISNTKLKIQKGDESCVIGQSGELWIGGDCLSIGYINASGNENSAFIQVESEENRYYKTGDLVRLLPNGNLEYLGRIDEQVKINGYRVELGEIESHLSSLNEISNVAVLFEKDEANTPVLMAFFEAEMSVEISRLRSFLTANLPSYMVPQHFYQVKRLPLTSNGKLDRKQLLEMRATAASSVAEYVAPSTDEEKQIVSVWSQLLKLEEDQIGIKHRFFEVGGDSIKVIRLVVELRKMLDYKLTVEDIYNHDTIEGLVNYVAQNRETLGLEDEKRQHQKEQILTEMEELKQRVSSTNLLQNENVEDLYPMSDIEKGMVFGYLLNEGTGTYHDQMVFTNRFESFDLERFRRALNLLSSKHEILRTGFDLSNFETEIQIVYKSIESPIYFEDISLVAVEEQERHIGEFLKRQLDNMFEVEKAPLWRMSIFKIDTDNYAFIFEFHHAILDGWSDASFVTELNNVYLTLAKTPDFIPTRLKSSYKDFIIEQMMSHSDEKLKEFWKTELTEYERLDLFTEEEEISRFLQSKGHEYLVRLEERAAELQTTVKTLSLSAYLILLQTLNSEPEIVSGLVTNNRPNIPDGDKIVGCFLNTIPFKTRFDSEMTLREVVQKVHDKTIELKSFDALSLFAITEICQEKSEHANPFFDVMFNYVDFHVFNEVKQDDNINPASQTSQGPALESHERTNTYFDFTVSATGDEYGLLISATNKLKSGLSIDYLGNLYFKIVDAILDDLSLTPGEIQVLDDQEINELTEVLNDSKFEFDTNENLIDYFENQVAKHGSDVALADGKESLTYIELNERSNQLAEHLIGLFLNDQSPTSRNIGVLLERSVDSVIAMIGIMKAGACYVPINHEHPSERVHYVVEDASLETIIGENHLFTKHSVEVRYHLSLSTIYSNKKVEEYLTNPPKTYTLDDVAAVFYTSGSSGKPKGVLQTHRMMRNLIHWDVELSGIEKGLKHLQFNSFSFDACIQDVFFALCSGGSLYMVKESSRLDYHQLINEIISNQIEVLFMPFSALNAMSFEVELDQIHDHSIKYIISTAEQLVLNKNLTGFLQKYPDIELRNYYGPSETHIVTKHVMSARMDNLESPAPVGQPIANSQIFIVNGRGKLVPKGVTGEIYIGGENLAAGYLNLKELSDEKFINSPFDSSAKLYKTGDRGYWRDDNNLIFLGRKDDQIKIRGFRVELGEIQYALSQHDQIEKAVVLAKRQDDNEFALVAYFESSDKAMGEETIESGELRSFLKKTLPDYMIPSYFVSMENIPLTNNGKIDKKVLPLPEDFGKANDQEFVPPQNDLQRKLVRIWEAVLKRERIGVRNDFFALGGHSLKVVRLSNKYQKEFGVKVPLKELFDQVTIEQQSALIESKGEHVFVPIEPVPEQENYPISDAQRRLWVLSQFEDEAVSYNMPERIYLDEHVNLDAFKKAVYSTIERHEILRTVFKENEEGEIRQWVLKPSELNFTIDYQDFRNAESEEVSLSKADEYIETDTYVPFDFENGPLLRAAILQVKDNAFVFYYNLNHIISDGVSGEVMAKDVMSFYSHYLAESKEHSAPDKLRIQYKDYSAWQLEQVQTPEFEKHRDFWLNSLSGDLPVIDLPSSKKRPALKSTNGKTLGIFVDKQLTKKLKTFCQEHGGTLFTGLLASLNALIYRYSGQSDLIIGSPVAGREHPDLDGQIGFYVNTLALRNQVLANDSFHELFGRVKENVFNAFSHQMYPFDRLVGELDLPRDTSRSAVFDVMLVHQNSSQDEQINTDFTETDEIIDFGAKTSKFDLLITTEEVGGSLSIKFEYNNDVYEDEMMTKLLKHYKSFIKKLIEEPDVSIGEVNYLSTEEREQLIFGLNDTLSDFGDTLVMDLFEQQVRKTPEKTAVVQGKESMSYAELNESSNRLAHEIRKRFMTSDKNDRGINDVRIGVMLDRSVHSVIAMFGAMKSGAVYVPLSKKQPKERIEYIVRDAELSGVVCDKIAQEEYDFETPIHIEDALENNHVSNPKCLNQLADECFIIYTSGSTGMPKGVIQSHLMMRNLICWDLTKSGIDRDVKLLHYNDFGFDVSIQDCWSPLSAGGTIYVTKEEERIDFKSIWHTIVHNEIEAISFPYSALHQLILQNESEDYSRLKIKHIISSGEQLIVNPALHEFLTNHPTVMLHNLYGPSETHVATHHSMSGELKNLVQYAPIGKPISNMEIYILDGNGSIVPQGVKGELFIGGDNLSPGYLNLKEETEKRFVSHPFKEGEKVYRTGDQAIWQLDGNLVFLGRDDDQVKIRGFRIELQEIESVLQQMEAIKEAVVIVRNSESEENEMIAYLRSDTSLKLDELRSFLKRKIPAYMIPSQFIEVEEFKLTINGKVDKRALLELGGSDMNSGEEYVAPESSIEKQLVEIWEEVLQREKIGVNDDFFNLGGHSIKAAKVVSRINQVYQSGLKIGHIFSTPTIADLAYNIEFALNQKNRKSNIQNIKEIEL